MFGLRQLLMCIQNAHGCVFLISITGEKYMLCTQDLYGIQLYSTDGVNCLKTY